MTADFYMKAEVKQWTRDGRFFQLRPLCFKEHAKRSLSQPLCPDII